MCGLPHHHMPMIVCMSACKGTIQDPENTRDLGVSIVMILIRMITMMVL